MRRGKFSFKNYAENKVGRLVPDVYFLKKHNKRWKMKVSIYFDSPHLAIQ